MHFHIHQNHEGPGTTRSWGQRYRHPTPRCCDDDFPHGQALPGRGGFHSPPQAGSLSFRRDSHFPAIVPSARNNTGVGAGIGDPGGRGGEGGDLLLSAGARAGEVFGPAGGGTYVRLGLPPVVRAARERQCGAGRVPRMSPKEAGMSASWHSAGVRDWVGRWQCRAPPVAGSCGARPGRRPAPSPAESSWCRGGGGPGTGGRATPSALGRPGAAGR